MKDSRYFITAAEDGSLKKWNTQETTVQENMVNGTEGN